MKKIYKLTFFILTLQFASFQNAFSQAPTLSPIQGQTIMCSSASTAFATYSVTGTNNPSSYYWTVYSSDGTAVIGNQTGASTSIYFSTYSSFASYTLICYGQNSSGVSTPVTMVVKVFETPNVTFSGSNNLCQGGSGNLSASSISSTLFQSSSTTIFWAPATGLSSTNSQSVIANPPTTTNYTILTSFGPCTSTNYFLVTVTPAPVVNGVFSPSVICSGQTSTLTVMGTSPSYSVNGVPFSGPTTYTPGVNSTYTVSTAGSTSCPSATTTVALTVNPAPIIIAAITPSIICKGETSILTVSGTGTTYSVNGIAFTSPASTYSPASNASYMVSGTGANGCQSSVNTVNLIVNTCTGLNEFKSKSLTLSLYPNPNNGSFVLKSETDLTALLINELGQIIKTLNLKANSENLITGLNAGIYFIVSGSEKKKIVVTP